jgi:hypothetical protein
MCITIRYIVNYEIRTSQHGRLASLARFCAKVSRLTGLSARAAYFQMTLDRRQAWPKPALLVIRTQPPTNTHISEAKNSRNAANAVVAALGSDG